MKKKGTKCYINEWSRKFTQCTLSIMASNERNVILPTLDNTVASVPTKAKKPEG